METDFFTKDVYKNKIKRIHNAIEKLAPSNGFEKIKKEHLLFFLNSFSSVPEEWTRSTSFNINEKGWLLIDAEIPESLSSSDIDELLSICFRFSVERYITDNLKDAVQFLRFREFVIKEKDKFHASASQQISYALFAMPIDIYKYHFNSDKIEVMKDFTDKYQKSKNLNEAWITEINEKEEIVKKLKSSLDEQEEAFNFVGLHKGFRNLGKIKRLELKTTTILLRLLGFSILIPIIFEISFILIKGSQIDLPHVLMTAIPATSLLFILIYFFKISLYDYKSIKAQINQIELRKSLCMFIQSYVKYAKEMKGADNATLDKFENVIFSNILMSEEKLPSTFDGLESIANLVKNIKNQ